jgi:hypothetical protein
MTNKYFIRLFFAFFLVHSSSYHAFAQFQQLPTPNKISSTNTIQFRSSSKPLIAIPFWDDFSSAGIDTSLWISSGVTHSFTVGNLPPSLGVAVFDGISANGSPYAEIPTAQGITDQLISKPIDLSAIAASEKETVFLSFYWQAGGKAEIPDVNDQIVLQFLNNIGDWIDVWNQYGALEAEQFYFTQETIQVEEIFQHEAFQFRFQVRGRASGPFDSWLIDYVYLNKNRTSGNQAFFDRTLTQLNSPIYTKYAAVPLFELQAAPDLYLSAIQNEFNNLENRFRAMEYTVEFREKESQEVLLKVNNNTPFNPVPLALERRRFSSNPITALPLPEEESDWELVSYLSSGDGALFQIVNGDSLFFPEIDLRKNDTARTAVPLRDYFAYDAGHIDYSAGINQRSGMLAVKYEKTQAAYLKGISINFTNFSQFGSGIDVMVWNELDSKPIYVKEALIPSKENLEEFAYFEIDENILLADVFYIGFTQFTNDFLYVGLDKTRDNGAEIYYNVAGSWQQNEFVAGSLMMRPHLSKTPPIKETGAEAQSDLLLYPNPTSDFLRINGEFELTGIIDPFGRTIKIPVADVDNGKILSFANFMRGLYLIKVMEQGKPKSYRILVK